MRPELAAAVLRRSGQCDLMRTIERAEANVLCEHRGRKGELLPYLLRPPA